MIDQYREGYHAGYLAAREDSVKVCRGQVEAWEIATAIREATAADILADLIKALPLPSREE